MGRTDLWPYSRSYSDDGAPVAFLEEGRVGCFFLSLSGASGRRFRFLEIFRCRFYERAVKIKHLTADRPTGRKPIVAASPASVETNDFNLLCRHSAPHHNVMSSSETEKQCGGGDRRPRFY